MRERRMWGIYLCLLSVALLVGLTACKADSQTVEQVIVQFNRGHSVEFAGFYAAVARGYYENAGIAVWLLPGDADTNAVQAIASGAAMFGIAASDELVRARDAGQALMAVSSIYRYNPTVIMALRDAFIREPKELIGKTVGVSSPELNASGDIQLLELLYTAEISPSRMTFVPFDVEERALDTLLAGDVDAVSGLLATQDPLWASEAGYTVTVLFPGDYAALIYPNLIVAQEQLVDSEPGLVARFVQATLQGYHYALEHPDEVAAMTLAYDDSLDLGAQTMSMHAQIPYIDTGVPLGTMDAYVWESTQSMLLQQERISSVLAVEQLYTNEFIPSTESVSNVQY